MSTYKAAARRYLIGVCLAALAVIGYIVLTDRPEQPDWWLPCLLLTGMGAVSHLYPVRSAKENSFYVLGTVFLLSAIMLLPPFWLTLHCVLVMVPYTIWNRAKPRVWIRWAFNTAQTLLAALTTRWILEVGGWDRFDGPTALVLVAAAIVLLPLLQGLLVSLIINLNNATRLLDAPPLQQDTLLSEMIMAMMGVMIAALWYVQPWFLALLPVPLVVVQTLMRRVHMVQLADLDAKTGLYNYRYFEQASGQEFQAARKVRRPTGLMFMDLDYLRHINNQYGHLAGDHVLKEVATLLSGCLRSGDILARFGGEEFVAMLPGTDKREAHYVAERMRRAVEQHPFVFEGKHMRATISIGVVAYPVDGDEPAALIRRADELLYQAKAQGRNRVCLATAEGEEESPTVPEEYAGLLAGTPADALSAAAVATQVAASAVQEQAPVAAPASDRSASASGQEHEPAPAAAVTAPLQIAWFARMLPRLIAGAGFLVTALVIAQTPRPYPGWGALLLVAGLAVVAEQLRVHVYEGNRQGISITMSTGAIMAGVALLDGAGALGVALASGLTHVAMSRKRNLEKVAFNIGNLWLSTGAAFLVHRIFPYSGDELTLYHVPGPVLASLTFYVVNTGLLHLVIAAHTRRDPVASWRENLWFAPALLLLGLLGAFVGATYRVLGPVGAVVFVTPVLILRYSFALYARRAQQAIEELEAAKAAVEASQVEKERTMDQLIVTISAIIDARDRSVSGHSRQVARYAVALAEEMGLLAEHVQRIRIAALLHDLGKIGVPESILHKPSRLTPEEYAIIQNHAPLGSQILSEVWALQDVARMVGEHHEHFNGAGYPFGKQGEQITIGGRIIAVADCLDTILSDRPYSRAKPLSWALEEFQRCSGTQFDPDVVAALLRLAAKQDRSFFVNSARTGGAEERVRNLFAVAGGKTTQ